MSLRDLNLLDAYDSGNSSSDILQDFYLPALSESVSYDRLTGYFSPGVFAEAARGIAGLVARGGKMRLVTSPEFREEEIRALQTAQDPKIIDDMLVARFRGFCDDVDLLADKISKDYISALGWMLKEGSLEIRVLVPKDISPTSSLFHSKVGVLCDLEGNAISFSGSVNETVAGWRYNIEEFKVFRSWNEGTAAMVTHDKKLFEKYWEPAREVDFATFEIPLEARRLLEERAPADFIELNLPETESLDAPGGFQLWEYQEDAIRHWSENGHRGILAMATGSGKTKTACEAIRRVQAESDSSVTVITCPLQHIATNWREELVDTNPICTFESGNWRAKIADAVNAFRAGRLNHLTLIAIQNTAAKEDFVRLVEMALKSAESSLLVADEAHGLGAPEFRKALLPGYGYRLALSATPTRHMDEEGTKVLDDYFEGTVFEFSLEDGLTWRNPITGETPLCPYDYRPVFVGLDADEMADWLAITGQLVKSGFSDRSSLDSYQKLLLIRRAAIAKSARQKTIVLEATLNEIEDLKHCLIYCSDSKQMSAVMEVLDRFSATYRRFTGEESTTPDKRLDGLSERENILRSFAEGNTEVLVAMKCLDEGVDVPAAKTGIILASSTNQREFVQRRGRLLRRADGKEKATIYDFLVTPAFSSDLPEEHARAASNVISRELTRSEEFSRSASNSIEAATRVLERITELGYRS